MSNYEFMKSGLVKSMLTDDEIIDIGSVFVLLIQNAVNIAGTYTEHAKRNSVTEKDAMMSLKLEVQIFCDRMDTVERAKSIADEWRDSFDEDDYEDDVKGDTFKKSECNCYLCEQMNNIDKLWAEWVPSNDLERLLKRNTDKL